MASKPTGNPKGRPTDYSPEMAQYVCDMIATHGCGLDKLSKMYDKFPSKFTVYEWINKYSDFSNLYFEARRKQSAVLADSMLDLADNIPVFEDKEGNLRIDAGMLGRAKLDMEIKKWHAAKMAPKIYGDAKQVEELSADKERLMRELQELRSQLDEKNKKEY